MSTVASEHILRTLHQAREELEQDYQSRKSAIDGAILAFGDSTPAPKTEKNGESKLSARDLSELSIGSDKLNKVRNVLRTTNSGRLRQADITKKAKLNSGTVSVALRKLEAANEVRSTGQKEDGSMVWEEIRPTTAAATGEGH